MELFDNNPPQYAFRFYSELRFDHFYETISNNSLYFAFPKEFANNDYFDCKHFDIIVNTIKDVSTAIDKFKKTNYSLTKNIESTLEELERRINLYGSEKEFAKAFAKDITTVYKRNWDIDRFGILCLAEHPTKEMWKNYCCNYKGFCIQIDLRILVEKLNNHKVSKKCNEFWCAKVKYIKELMKIPFNYFINDDPSVIAFMMLFLKMEHYSFEKEIRIVIPEIIDQKISFPDGLIKNIYIGENTSDKFVKKLEELNNGKKNKINIIDYRN